jgi:hypothetical protein
VEEVDGAVRGDGGCMCVCMCVCGCVCECWRDVGVGGGVIWPGRRVVMNELKGMKQKNQKID